MTEFVNKKLLVQVNSENVPTNRKPLSNVSCDQVQLESMTFVSIFKMSQRLNKAKIEFNILQVLMRCTKINENS